MDEEDRKDALHAATLSDIAHVTSLLRHLAEVVANQGKLIPHEEADRAEWFVQRYVEPLYTLLIKERFIEDEYRP